MVNKGLIAQRLRRGIIAPRHEHQDVAQNVEMNVSVLKSVGKLGDFLDKLSSFEDGAVAKLTKELRFIPLSMRQLQNHQERLFNNLVRMVVILEKRASKEQDPQKKTELENAARELRTRGENLGHRFGQSGGEKLSLRQGIGQNFYGLNPHEVKAKGLIRTMFARTGRIITGKEQAAKNGEGFGDIIEKYGHIYDESVEADSKTNQVMRPASVYPEAMEQSSSSNRGGRRRREKTRDALEGSTSLLNGMLLELTVIRKLMEGRVDYNPKTGQYVGANANDSSFFRRLRTPGDGLYSRSEDRGRRQGFMGSTEDPNNENVDRDPELDQNIFDDAGRYGAAGTRSGAGVVGKAGADDLFGGLLGQKDPSGPSSGGGIPWGVAGGGIAAILGRGVIKKITTKFASKTAGTAAAKVGGKGIAKMLAKGAGKSLLKKLPFVGLAIGAKWAYDKYKTGDKFGAAGELASGMASMIPGIGTAASVAIDAGLAGRDISKSMAAQKDTTSMIEQLETAGNQAEKTASGGATVINNYSTPSTGAHNPTLQFIPEIRNTANSFLRFQDKRMTRVL